MIVTMIDLEIPTICRPKDDETTQTVGKPGDPYVRRNPLPDIPILSRTVVAPAG